MTKALSILAATLALAGAAALLAWRHDRAALLTARAGAEAKAEAERVAKAGVLVAAKAAQDEADRQRKALEAESATFRAESERQLAAARGRIETLMRLKTGTLVAGGDVRPAAPPDPAGGPPGTCPPCLLAAGDRGELLARVSEVRHEHGTLSVAGDAEAARIDPDGSRHVLLAGAWAADRSLAIEVPTKVEVQRARFMLRGGVVDLGGGGYGGAGLRIAGPLWAEVTGQVAHGAGQGTAGLAWEVR